ncbi:choline/ethanolamine kinase family protein [Dactylosporangium aurantiacum]|uniref:choline/ethanolamine kinase family protein n=1 Tax=Dactylosporangium aurantiacum TaxID=35754 RepID=UPI0009DF6F4B|nr:choline/ethanolamine kinase family protein [Dactylosporangium aurantiacum]
MTAVPSIADLLERVPSWIGRAVEWQRLQGGLSHHIYRVDVDRVPYVLRVLEPAVSAAGLGIPPEQEIANTVLAAHTVGAKVYEILPDVPAVVIEFLPGRTLGAAEVRRPEIIPSIATACRRLHAGPAFGNDFDIFAKRAELLDVCARHDLPLPDGYLDRSSTVDAIAAALAEAPLPSVPCHNDLLAENFIATGDGVRIIDYQLSGNNDPAFELGDIAAEADYDPDLAGLLAGEYFADADEALRARVRLYQVASNVTWTLWFTVHHGLLSARDLGAFDYAAEAADKWGQAQEALDDPGLGRLLAAASGRTPHP